MKRFYATESEIEAVVRGFESCETDKTNFKHRDHLTVAVYYLQGADIQQATERMRSALFAFLDHHGVDRKKYNETITVFWMELVSQALSDEPPGFSLLEKCNLVIESLQNASLQADYYSTTLLGSDEARKAFVKPDLKAWRKS